jgi:DNA-binding Lrp family transcriptional regulator
VGLGPSSVTYQVRKLEAAGVLVANAQKRREITKLGADVLRFIDKR